MADFDHQSNLSAYYNTFKVSLTRQQQQTIHTLLPKTYSFQPYKSTRSLDQQSLDNKPLKKKHQPLSVKDEKDPDYSAPYVPRTPKEPPSQKPENPPGIPGGQAFMECYLILKKLKKSIYSWPFKVPVDPKALKIPEYLNVIQEPMDLRTMEDHLKKQVYSHPSEFHRDIYKMLMNSYKFNQKNSEVFQTTADFQEEYIKIVKDAKEGKLKFPDKKITQEEIAVSQPIIPEGLTSMEVQKPVPQTKPVRHYTKKDKSQKPDSKDKERSAHKEKDRGKMDIEKQDDTFKIKQQHMENSFMNPFQTFHSPIEQKILQQPPKQQIKVEPKYQIKSEKKPSKIEPRHNIKTQIKQQVPSKNEQGQSKPAKDIKVEHKESNQWDPEFSVSLENMKKSKSKVAHDKKHKQKKQKLKKVDVFESPSEIKELKQTTQAQNEKAKAYSDVQKRLNDVVKKLGQYIFPKAKITKQSQKAMHKNQHPNFTNFTTVTATEKKKLAQKIASLSNMDLKYVIQICYRNKRLKSRDDEGVYQIDLEKLDGKVLKELSNFIGMRIRKPKKETGKSNESQKGNDKSNPEEPFDQDEAYEPEQEEVDEQDENRLEEPEDFNRLDEEYYLMGHDPHEPFRDPSNDGRNFRLEMIESQQGHNNNDDMSDAFPF